MKQFLKSGLAAAVMAVGIASAGCEFNINRGHGSRDVVYRETSAQSYWVHDGRVYGRESGNFYVYDGNRRGPIVSDRNVVVRIQSEGSQHRDYIEADRGRHNRIGRRN